MNFDAITDYLLVSEVRARWALPPESMMLHRAVMKDVLKVCMWLKGTFQQAAPDPSGKLVPLEKDGQPVPGVVNSWCYVLDSVQTDAFEMEYRFALDESGEEPRYLVLPQPCLLSRMLEDGVVMLHDLTTAELFLKPPGVETWQARAAATKEVHSMLRLISAMAADAYRYDPRRKERIETVDCLQAATAIEGEKPMHAQTITKYLDRAVSEYPPEYMQKKAAASLAAID